jgi:hypothetical protein
MYRKRFKYMLRLGIEGVLTPYVLGTIVVILVNRFLFQMYCLSCDRLGYGDNIRLKVLQLLIEGFIIGDLLVKWLLIERLFIDNRLNTSLQTTIKGILRILLGDVLITLNVYEPF